MGPTEEARSRNNLNTGIDTRKIKVQLGTCNIYRVVSIGESGGFWDRPIELGEDHTILNHA